MMHSVPLDTLSKVSIRWCSIIALVVSVVFLGISVFAYNYRDILVSHLVPVGIATLVLTISLNVHTLRCVREEQRAGDQAFRYVDREFSSIFQNVLDGILIVDSTGTCLDANPAAAAILRCPLNAIVAHKVARFVPNTGTFTEGWSEFLEQGTRRGRAQLVAGDGTHLVVDFTVVSNYLPGRHALVICDVTERARAESSLRSSEARFQEMANNIAEIFWTMDAKTQEITYVNSAFATITGHDIGTLHSSPPFYRNLIHPEDRVRVLSRLQETLTAGIFDEEFRLTRSDGAVRWIWAKGFLVPPCGEPRRIVGTAQDITPRKQAEMRLSEQLDLVETARAEAEALRKATLALSQNLSMDSVLDTLLKCIGELVPFDKASVLFIDDPEHMFVAREVPRCQHKGGIRVLGASDNPILQRILFDRRAVLVSDTGNQLEWNDSQPFDRARSWLGIPLAAAAHVIGVLSLCSSTPRTFTAEHLRVAKNLAISAAVAIENARAHERAEIYAEELEQRLNELREVQKTLERVGGIPPK